MYKFKLTLKDKHSRTESIHEANTLQNLINTVNANTNVSFIIVKAHNYQIMLKGSK